MIYFITPLLAASFLLLVSAVVSWEKRINTHTRHLMLFGQSAFIV